MSQPAAEATPKAPAVAKEPLFTRDFILASVMTLATFSSFYLLMATLPVYVMSPSIRGTASDVGLIMALFSASAVVIRPFVGKGTDDHGKRPFILGGSLLFSLMTALYALVVTIPMMLVLRLFHGAGWASAGTATNALVADLAPRSRRGEAMGYYGMFSNVAMAAGPALGVILMNGYGFSTLFAASAALAVAALLLALAIREPARSGPQESVAAVKGGILERSALFPSATLALTTINYASIVSFVPLYATGKGIGNPGVFFTVYAITMLVARGFTGQLSDRYGRAAVIAPGLALAVAGPWVLAFADATAALMMPLFLTSAVLYGLAFAAIQPALMAFVVDRAAPARRGAAVGTFSTAIDLGIGIGSVAWGYVVQAAGYETMYFASGGVALVTLLFFLAGMRMQGKPRRNSL